MSPLLPEDFTNPAVLRLKAHYDARLAELREKNDKRLSQDNTARLRGQIFEVRNLLALVTNRQPFQEANDA